METKGDSVDYVALGRALREAMNAGDIPLKQAAAMTERSEATICARL